MHPTLILVNNDEIDVEWMSKFFHDRKGVSALHGFGETLLVKNGKVYERLTRIHESSAEQLAELIEEFAS